jgi:hypothetical protein
LLQKCKIQDVLDIGYQTLKAYFICYDNELYNKSYINVNSGTFFLQIINVLYIVDNVISMCHGLFFYSLFIENKQKIIRWICLELTLLSIKRLRELR